MNAGPPPPLGLAALPRPRFMSILARTSVSGVWERVIAEGCFKATYRGWDDRGKEAGGVVGGDEDREPGQAEDDAVRVGESWLTTRARERWRADDLLAVAVEPDLEEDERVDELVEFGLSFLASDSRRGSPVAARLRHVRCIFRSSSRFARRCLTSRQLPPSSASSRPPSSRHHWHRPSLAKVWHRYHCTLTRRAPGLPIKRWSYWTTGWT